MGSGLFSGRGVFRQENAPLFALLAGGVLSGDSLAQGLGAGLQAAAPLLQQRQLRNQQLMAAQGLLSDPSIAGNLSEQARAALAQSPELANRFAANVLERQLPLSRGEQARLDIQREQLELARQRAGQGDFQVDAFGRVFNRRTGEFTGGAGAQPPRRFETFTDPQGNVMQRDVLTGRETQLRGVTRATSAERRVGAFARRLIASETELRDIGPQVDNILIRNAPVGQNFLRSNAGRQYRAAAERWIAAFLRRESGATIRPDEFDEDFRRFFPQPGDDLQTRANKQAARLEVIGATVEEAGIGFTQQRSLRRLQERIAAQQRETREADQRNRRIRENVQPGGNLTSRQLRSLPEGAVIRQDGQLRIKVRGRFINARQLPDGTFEPVGPLQRRARIGFN